MTRQERLDAEAAIYGIPPKHMMPTLSPQEVEKMRQIVAHHDQQHGNTGVIKEFDLNNPNVPRVRFQEFPKMVYDHAKRTTKTVHSEAEEKAALAAGFTVQAFLPDGAVPAIEEDESEEIARIDAIAKQKKQPK